VVGGDGGRVVERSVGGCVERHGRGVEHGGFLERKAQAEASGAKGAASAAVRA
jgi:hypothetical protein